MRLPPALLFAVLLPGCVFGERATTPRDAGTSGGNAVRSAAASGSVVDLLRGGVDPVARVESGRMYETHGWVNLAKRQYLEAIRLAPGKADGYDALTDHLARVRAWTAGWLVVDRARKHRVAIDPVVLNALDDGSHWPISSVGVADAPREIVTAAVARFEDLHGVDLRAPREQLDAGLRRLEDASDKILEVGLLCLPEIRRALAAERDDPVARVTLCTMLLRLELTRRALGEPADTALVEEAVAALLTAREPELWPMLWNAGTLLARLGDRAGDAVLARFLQLDDAQLPHVLPAPKHDWDMLLVFALGPLGDRACDLIEPALRGAQPAARANALRVQSALFHDRLLPAVHEAAKAEWLPEFRLLLALSHLQFRHPDTYSQLLQVLDHPTATEVHRLAAVHALGELNTSEARDALEHISTGGPDAVSLHAQRVLADLSREDADEFDPEDKALDDAQTRVALAELILEYGVGVARLQGSFLRSCSRRHLPLLYELRGRIVWRVTESAISDLEAVNEIIRHVIRQE